MHILFWKYRTFRFLLKQISISIILPSIHNNLILDLAEQKVIFDFCERLQQKEWAINKIWRIPIFQDYLKTIWDDFELFHSSWFEVHWVYFGASIPFIWFLNIVFFSKFSLCFNSWIKSVWLFFIFSSCWRKIECPGANLFKIELDSAPQPTLNEDWLNIH